MSWDFGGGSSSRGNGNDWEDVPSDVRPIPASADPGSHDVWQPSAATDGGTSAAPTPLLVVGVVLAGVSTVIALVSDSATLASLGWMLGGPCAIGSLAIFLQVDTRRRSQPWYADSSLVPWLRRGLVLLAILAVALNAWTISNSIARGTWS